MGFALSIDRLLALVQGQVIGGGDLSPQQVVTGISTDSRTLNPGQAFVALRGERFDGHQFLTTAQERGAAVALVDRHWEFNPQELNPSTGDMTLIQVPDTLKAYQAIAQGWRRQFSIPIVAITGSVGKTTTKELIAAMLGTQGAVLKTEANYNNEVGVPKTLLNLGPEHRYGVIEMAMRGRDQIRELAAIAEPTIGVITNVGVAHIELLGSREAIAQAKCELLEEMTRQQAADPQGDRRVILNHDNPLLMATAASRWLGPTQTFGFGGGTLQGKMLDPETLQVGDRQFHLPFAGEHHGLNFLAALAVAQTLGLDLDTFRDLQVTLPGGRAKRLQWARDVVVLDETYNAGPESMAAALRLLRQLPGKRHLAILGTMKELGEQSVAFHQEIGELVQSLGLDGLSILADPAEAEALATGAGSVPSHCFTQPDDLVQWLAQTVQPGDRLLFKASRSVALDQVITALQPLLNP